MNALVVRFLAAAGAAFAALVLAATPVQAEGASVQADVQCDPTDAGVVDITLLNDGEAPAQFDVNGTNHMVGAGSAYAITFTGVDNGLFVLPITADGVDATVHLSVDCEMLRVEVAPRGVESFVLPATGNETEWGLGIGGGLVAAGVAASLVARRRYS